MATTHTTVTSGQVSVLWSEWCDAYVRKDCGAGYFSGDFSVLFGLELAVPTSENAVLWAVCLGDGGTSYQIQQDMVGVSVEGTTGGTFEVAVGKKVAGEATLSATPVTALAVGTPYYCTLTRSSGSVALSVYSDSARQTLVGTDTGLADSASFQYLYAALSNNTAWAAFQEGETTSYLASIGAVRSLDYGSGVEDFTDWDAYYKGSWEWSIEWLDAAEFLLSTVSSGDIAPNGYAMDIDDLGARDGFPIWIPRVLIPAIDEALLSDSEFLGGEACLEFEVVNADWRTTPSLTFYDGAGSWVTYDQIRANHLVGGALDANFSTWMRNDYIKPVQDFGSAPFVRARIVVTEDGAAAPLFQTITVRNPYMTVGDPNAPIESGAGSDLDELLASHDETGSAGAALAALLAGKPATDEDGAVTVGAFAEGVEIEVPAPEGLATSEAVADVLAAVADVQEAVGLLGDAPTPDALLGAVQWDGQSATLNTIHNTVTTSAEIKSQFGSDHTPRLVVTTTLTGEQFCGNGDWVVKLRSGEVRILSDAEYTASYSGG